MPPVLVGLLYGLLVAVVSGPAVHVRLDGDDFIWLFDASQITGVWDLFGVHDVPFAPYDGVRLNPTNTFLFAALWPFFGVRPEPYHVAVLVLYGLTGWLLRLWLRDLGLGETAASLGGAAFLVHPLHAEPIAWLAASGEVLVGFFTMATLVSWERGSRPGSRVWDGAAALCAAAAVLAKEAALVLPLALLAYDLLLGTRPMRWIRHLPIWGVTIAVAAWKQMSIAAVRADIGIHPSALTWVDAIRGTLAYVGSCAAGPSLAARLTADVGAPLATVGAVAVLGGVACLTWLGWRRVAFHAVWLLIAVQPYVWWVPMQTLRTRYAFQPSLPMLALVACLFDGLLRRLSRRGARVALAAAAVGCIGVAGLQLRSEASAMLGPDDGPALSASLAAATRGCTASDRVHVYNTLTSENAAGRAVVLLGAADAGQVVEWYEMLGRDTLDAHDRFVHFDAGARCFTDLTDAIHALHPLLRGRLPRGAHARDTATCAAAWTVSEGDGAGGLTLDAAASAWGRGVPPRWTWGPDGGLYLSGLDLSPLAVYVLVVEWTPRTHDDALSLEWTSEDSPYIAPECTVSSYLTMRSSAGRTDQVFVPADASAWWNRGVIRQLSLRASHGDGRPRVHAVRMYTFGALR